MKHNDDNDVHDDDDDEQGPAGATLYLALSQRVSPRAYHLLKKNYDMSRTPPEEIERRPTKSSTMTMRRFFLAF